VSSDAEKRLHRALAESMPGCQANISACSGGANNRVFRLRMAQGRDLCAKVYFREAGGDPPGFLRERAFYQACGAAQEVPRAVGWHKGEAVGFFEWVEGRKHAEPSVEDVAAAGRFIRRLQELGREADWMPASDACWSETAHLESVDRRIDVLASLVVEGTLPPAVAEFVKRELDPGWRGVRESFGPAQAERMEKLVISPSDFGFHNALQRADESWCFLDFEYAGLDDPAKLLCDFLARPGADLPAASAETFCSAADFAGDVRERVERLLPVHRIKWACIALNDFIPEARSRRSFARHDAFAVQKERITVARGLLKGSAGLK